MPAPTTERDPGDATGPELLNLSQVRQLNGVSVETLRLLISDRLLPGVVREARGHVRLRADQVPTFADVVELLTHQLLGRLRKAQAQMRRVHVEMEAVDNDIEMAIENPLEDLGHDLTTLRTSTHDPRASSLASALLRLEMLSWEVRRYQDALRELTGVTASQTD